LTSFLHRRREIVRQEQDMTKLRNIKKKTQSVATILEREIEPMREEWLRRVKFVPELTRVPLTDEDRSDHLPKLFHDVICRLRLVKHASHTSPPTLPRTGDCGGSRATLPPWSSRSHGRLRSLYFTHYISTRVNSISNRCF
jgi:hypothetical protein